MLWSDYISLISTNTYINAPFSFNIKIKIDIIKLNPFIARTHWYYSLTVHVSSETKRRRAYSVLRTQKFKQIKKISKIINQNYY